jgi:hypothetical protein
MLLLMVVSTRRGVQSRVPVSIHKRSSYHFRGHGHTGTRFGAKLPECVPIWTDCRSETPSADDHGLCWYEMIVATIDAQDAHVRPLCRLEYSCARSTLTSSTSRLPKSNIADSLVSTTTQHTSRVAEATDARFEGYERWIHLHQGFKGR